MLQTLKGEHGQEEVSIQMDFEKVVQIRIKNQINFGKKKIEVSSWEGEVEMVIAHRFQSLLKLQKVIVKSKREGQVVVAPAFIPSTQGQEQVYRACSGTAKITHRNPVSKNNTKQQQEHKHNNISLLKINPKTAVSGESQLNESPDIKCYNHIQEHKQMTERNKKGDG